MKKPVVVHIVQHLAVGGIETLVLDIQQASKDDEVHIISLQDTQASAVKEWPRLAGLESRLHFLDKKEAWQLSLFWKCWRLLRQIKPTLVHTHHVGPLLYGNITARFAGIKNRIHTEHDTWHLAIPSFLFLERFALFLARPTVVANAKRVAAGLKKAIPSCQPRVIYNGINTERFSPGDPLAARKHFQLPAEAVLIGCAARLEEVKGHQYLIEAMKQLPEHFHLVLAGTGDCEVALRNQAQQLGLANRVIFLGRVDAMPLFHQAMDVFCLASITEGLPLAPMEAQACNKPVVLTDVGGSSEAACPLTSHLVPSQEPGILSEALLDRVSTPLENDPRDFVLKKRSLEAMLSAYRKLRE